jgi:hypothetical protein
MFFQFSIIVLQFVHPSTLLKEFLKRKESLAARRRMHLQAFTEFAFHSLNLHSNHSADKPLLLYNHHHFLRSGGLL